uniref:Uncharacterized protein n=1 Tax=Timema tahoe TaxID=61484 RepID=A0A7R9FMH1_9NEOP|nr:unnamed protein product [Timema tahoe]
MQHYITCRQHDITCRQHYITARYHDTPCRQHVGTKYQWNSFKLLDNSARNCTDRGKACEPQDCLLGTAQQRKLLPGADNSTALLKAVINRLSVGNPDVKNPERRKSGSAVRLTADNLCLLHII